MIDFQKDSKRDAILKSVEHEFILKGYDGARTMEIAQRAGVGHPLLHYHFKTKKELFKSVVQGKIWLLRKALLSSWDDTDGDLLDKLSRTIGQHFDFVRENADYLRFQFQEMERHQELFEEIKVMANTNMTQLFEKMQQEISDSAARGDIHTIDARTLLEDILALNLFFLTAVPTIRKIEGLQCDDEYFKKRKQENIMLIINRITNCKTIKSGEIIP